MGGFLPNVSKFTIVVAYDVIGCWSCKVALKMWVTSDSKYDDYPVITVLLGIAANEGVLISFI